MSNDVSKGKQIPNQEVIENIKQNYCQIEKSIVQQLCMRHDLHPTTIGSAREDIWAQLFEMVIPKKFVIEHSVLIIDSFRNVSREVDLAIMDETYTPYIFRYGRLKFIPIEAVAAVIECKSQSINKDAISKWIHCINKLKTTDGSIARTANEIVFNTVRTQKSTRPIRILCALKNEISDDLSKEFDFTLLAEKEKGKERLRISYSKDQNLFEWFTQLNFHQVEHDFSDEKENENCPSHRKHWKSELEKIVLGKYEVYSDDSKEEIISLLSFNFQLNQLLMLINNPILFPHRAYVQMFNGPERKDC
jgi:hypothetical protein